MKLTPKQDAFARAYVETGSQAEAYRRAYKSDKLSGNAIRVEACRLMDNPKVSLMVEKLQQRALKRHDITVDSLTEMLMEDRELAHNVEAPGAAVTAVMGLAKLHGLIVDKSKNEHTGADGAPLMPEINVTISRA